MISSLRSKFNLSPRRALYLGPESATLILWEDGGITNSFVFDADDIGVSNFERYLEETPTVPVYILVDVVEEEYKPDMVPHVFGGDRRAVIERKQKRLFRGTAYHHFLVQGRESQGRKDDRVLFTALMNPEALTPWIAALERFKVPLAGIYSLPILSELLLHELDPTSKNCLLISLQSVSGLRQSFFRSKHLKMSRVAKMPRFGTTPYAPIVIQELERFQRFLNSLRLISREDQLDIYILAHGALLGDLRRKCIDTETTRYRLIDIADLARRLGIEGILTTTFSDMLYAHLLLSRLPKNHYASPSQARYFTMQQTRIGLLTASVILLLGSAIWSSFNLIDGLSWRHEAIDAKQKSFFYQARYEEARKRLPPTAVPPMEIKSAIDIVDALSKRKTTPFDILRTVSAVLARYPKLALEGIDWIASSDPTRAPGAAAQPGLAPPPNPAAVAPTGYEFYQIAIVKGEITPFNGNYRTALDLVDRFARSLGSAADVVDVEIVEHPLDISSEASLQGAANTEERQKEAKFAVKIVMGVKDEKA